MISEVRQNAGGCVKEKVNEGSLRSSLAFVLDVGYDVGHSGASRPSRVGLGSGRRATNADDRRVSQGVGCGGCGSSGSCPGGYGTGSGRYDPRIAECNDQRKGTDTGRWFTASVHGCL